MEPVELLQQNLVIEPDLRNFIGFVLESVETLGGNCFAATIAALDLMHKLRSAGASTGQPLSTSLLLQDHQLLVQWGANGDCLTIVRLMQPPQNETITQLQKHLLHSTAQADPAILLQRNEQMTRHFNETRARTEKELEVLQQNLEKRQNELLDSMHVAETDPLTGLLNRRAFDERLNRAFHHAMRQKNCHVSLVLFDLDHFKEINDEFGHQFGDAHLKKMARILRSVIREDVDFSFRFGGDEFAVVIFADYPLACDKARQVLQLMDYKVSIGITAIDPETPDSLTLEAFFQRADNALYEAKHQGRGRAVVDVCHADNNSKCPLPCPEMIMRAHG